jgi:peroxiredoxin Q/BCP
MKKRSQKGSEAPDLTLPDQDGNDVPLSSYWKEGPLVLYFYPQDHTLGCTKEACSFRDGYGELREAGAEVVGISGDDAASHRRFREEHRLPFALLSDPDGKARKAFGVGRTLGLLPERVTFVIGTDGRILEVFNSQLQFRQHFRKALKAVRGAAPQG